ncbi:MAG: outer membrane beta-barrel family protein, partial [Muribaculaceae bacterium]|nr:outer membrane beta-barrel family protein [Muribaculaceae bacterium]
TNLRGTDIARGKMAVDVLPFLPNISREDGTFKINCLAVSEIYIDGVNLSDLSELDNLPGEMIDKIQVRYLAGADQNAALSGGSILITLRRPPEGGYYGSVTADADWYRSCGFGNEGLSGIINYRYKNLSIYDNFYIGGSKLQETAEQWLIGPELNTFLTENTRSDGFDFRNRLSLVQQFNSGVQLGASYLIATTSSKPFSLSSDGNIMSAIDKRTSTTVQEGTLQFSMPLNHEGAVMELIADYLNRNGHEHTSYTLAAENAGATHNKNNLNLWKFKADFLYPHSRNLTWKFGTSVQKISSAFTPVISVESDRFNISTSPSATSGLTPVVYASAQSIIRKLRYSAGLNWQLNKISYEDRNAKVTTDNTQWAINPTVQIMMPFGAKMNHAFMLNYKHTLSDIPYSAISSVINWEDSYNYTVGNPDLKAQSADMIMAGVSLFRNKINITALYAHSHNRIYWQTFQNVANHDVFYTKPINISGQGVWGFGAEWIEAPLRWWKFKLSGRIEITPENITIDNTHYGNTRFKEYFALNNNFSFSGDWGGILNLNFEPTFRTLDRTYHAVYNIEGRIYKTFFNNNLQIAVE